MRFWLKTSICQSSMVYEGCWVNCPSRAGNLEASTVCWRESARRVQLSGYHAAADRVRPARIECIAAENLVLSQEDKPERHFWISSWDLARNCHSLFKCTEDNSLWSLAQMLQTSLCSAAWSQSHLSFHSLINNVIVCNKSCYCFIIKRKLNNK